MWKDLSVLIACFCTQTLLALVPLFFLSFCNGTILHLVDFQLSFLHPTLLPPSTNPPPDIGVLDFSGMPGHVLFIHPVSVFQILNEILTLFSFVCGRCTRLFLCSCFWREIAHVCNSPCKIRSTMIKEGSATNRYVRRHFSKA